MLNFTGNFQEWNQFGADQDGDWITEDGGISINSDFGALDEENRKNIEQALDSLEISENIIKADSILLSNPEKHFKKIESDITTLSLFSLYLYISRLSE